jgi:hypothetical protein
MTLRDGTGRQLLATHGRLVKAMVDHIKEPLFVSRIARQADLFSAAFWRLGLGNVNKREVRPIN